VTGRDDVSRGRLHLSRAGVDVGQALAYCGDEEGFREIIAIFHAEGDKRRENLARYFKEQDWKNYVICVHALKGNARGIGAVELSEMARELEMAGKENRADYILEHHEAMMANHDRLLEALDGNAFIYPDAANDAPGLSAGQTSSADYNTADSPMENMASSESGADETADEASLQELLTQIGDKLSSFESEGLSDLLDRLAQRSYEGSSLAGLADTLRELTQDFDFLGASEVLERMGK
ncbi:MAG: Hpt domain-containing protein, partial [Lachnospiraceae bacterium]|nr:Hpt domain-containing protein [Lachnospiraceae bacterium]